MNILRPTYLHSRIVNQFHLSPLLRRFLERWYILHWSKSYLLEQLTSDETIIHADVEYIPIFRSDMQSEAIKTVKLSFRAPKIETGIPNYVLIRAA